MILNGFLVLDPSGIPIYSKTTALDLKLDTVLIGGFLSAVQSFARELSDDHDSYIKEMKVQNLSILYRQLEMATFIGITKDIADYKGAQVILEHMILAFLSKFRDILKSGDLSEISQFNSFDDVFLKFCTSKEKVLEKWVQKECEASGLLQGILNSLINYFPVKELVKLDKQNLNIIGDHLIWVKLNIDPDKEKHLIEILREKTSKIYGSKMFEKIVESAQEKMVH